MRYAIGDIHGCNKTLQRLVKHIIQPSSNDHLIFVGDYINKGKDSCGVIDYLLSLENKTQTIFIKGNHEDNLLTRARDYETEEFIEYVQRKQGNTEMLTPEGNIKPSYLEFLESLELYLELEEWIVVHAGLNLASQSPLNDRDAMMRIRNFNKDGRGFRGKRIVHGHQPTYQEDIKRAVTERAMVIPIDNGCVYNQPDYRYDYTRMGNLCALNLDTFELLMQENID